MSYEIKEVLNDVIGKFSAMVSFNGKKEERYEVESLDSAVIAETLTKVADESLLLESQQKSLQSQMDSIQIKDGQIVT